ncbi:unnamed protein product [Choristocarpus tenellus]
MALHQNASKRLKGHLRRVHFPVQKLRQISRPTQGDDVSQQQSNPWDGVVRGDPTASLVILHWILLDMSNVVAGHILSRGFVGLQGLTDYKFVLQSMRLLREEFNYMPQLTAEQFLTMGFAECKMRMLSEVVELVMETHHSLVSNSANSNGSGSGVGPWDPQTHQRSRAASPPARRPSTPPQQIHAPHHIGISAVGGALPGHCANNFVPLQVSGGRISPSVHPMHAVSTTAPHPSTSSWEELPHRGRGGKPSSTWGIGNVGVQLDQVHISHQGSPPAPGLSTDVFTTGEVEGGSSRHVHKVPPQRLLQPVPALTIPAPVSGGSDWSAVQRAFGSSSPLHMPLPTAIMVPPDPPTPPLRDSALPTSVGIFQPSQEAPPTKTDSLEPQDSPNQIIAQPTVNLSPQARPRTSSPIVIRSQSPPGTAGSSDNRDTAHGTLSNVNWSTSGGVQETAAASAKAENKVLAALEKMHESMESMIEGMERTLSARLTLLETKVQGLERGVQVPSLVA